MRVLIAALALLATGQARAAPKRAAPKLAALKPADIHKRAVELRALVRKTARRRQLWPRRRIKMGVMSRAQILTTLKARLDKEYTDEEIATDSLILQRLGLLPRGIDYKKTMLELLADQVAGFYDPHTRQLNIAAWLPLSIQQAALVHEICHALQDQYFGLKRFVRPIKDNTDRQLARLALAEGDCTGVMLEHLLASSGEDLGTIPASTIDEVSRKVTTGNQSAVFKAAPRFLRRTLTFPYLQGLRFVKRLRQRLSWQQLSRVFRRLPTSTEQVLHYEKYWSRERPVRIRVRPLRTLAATHRRVKKETLGEYQLRLHATLALGEQAAERAAAGWGGDRLAAYVPRPAATSPASPPATRALPLVALLSTWDSEADAIEFVNAERRVVATLAPQAQVPTHRNLWVHRDDHGLEWSVQRHRRHVLLLLGAPPALRAKLQAEVWARWTIGGRRTRVRLVALPKK